MKKNFIINILLASVLIFSTYSCSAGWLDVEASNEKGEDEVVESYSDARVALNGIYFMIKGGSLDGVSYTSYYTADMLYYGDVRADDIQTRTGATGRSVWAYNMAFTATSGTNNMWVTPYKVIDRANRLIRILDSGVIGDTPQKNVDDYKGQALMARALAHFDLLKLYSRAYDVEKNGSTLGVPIMTEPQDFTYQPARNTVNETYTQILADLEDAVKLMYGTRVMNDKDADAPNIGNTGYFNSWAAKALQARVYQYMGKQQEALDVAEDIINNSPYKLWTNEQYVSQWTSDPVEQNTESLFEIVITNTEDWTDREGIAYLYDGTGYYDMHLTKSFYEFLEENYKDDVRTKLLGTSPYIGKTSAIFEKEVFVTKYAPKTSNLPVGVNNLKLFRLSEVYLIAAEAAAHLGKQDVAAKYLNEIVLRGNPNATKVSDADATVDRVLQERRVELFAEGHRYFDLVRNNKDIIRFEYNDNDSDEVKLKKKGWHGNLAKEAQKFNRDYFRAILPIPEKEFDVNPNIIQNADY